MKIDLTGKRALVTGGSRGIGKEIARTLVSSGVEVIISGSSNETLTKTAEEIGATAIVADLFDGEAITNLIGQVGKIDILVNNAGINRDSLFIRQKDEDVAAIMQVNLIAGMKITQGVIPHMSRQKWGRVINISSVVGHMGNVSQVAYSASKAALGGFTKSLAKEYARKGITINTVAPGFIETDMTKGMADSAKEKLEALIPTQRFGTPAEVASAVVFLASDGAGYVNGSTIHVNGGMYV